ncbi:uncharacterized protein LOC143595955 [Bidens hawaiensis]|uniref:uncharacterized protein LOC143595955 n=1 Tax=Bidens hawaiensis TaxID=980011 RepID=UPI00404A56E6
MDRIATSDALFKRNVVNEIIWCPLCEGEKESAVHVLTSCYVATVIWQFISSWCGLNPVYAFDVRDLLKIHLTCGVDKIKQKALQALILTTCWCIWKARNEAIFDNKRVSVNRI